MNMNISKEVLCAIYDSIGAYVPEKGGMLGTSDGLMVDNYEFDYSAKVGYASYTPNVTFLDEALSDWCDNGVGLIGFVHSHPMGCIHPSNADINYTAKIIKAAEVDHLFIPIINNDPDTGFFKMYGYVVSINKKGKVSVCGCDIMVDGVLYTEGNPHDIFSEQLEDTTFNRISTAIDLSSMKDSLVLGIGCGGAREFYIDLARMGVGNFILIDGDTVSNSNIASQNVYANEVGMYKCEAIKERILQINPDARVLAYNGMLDDGILDSQFEEWFSDFNATNVVVCGFTDSFKAQARASRIAMKYKFPYIAAQHYEKGQMSEAIYWYPNISPKCPRCLLASRYEAYIHGGFENNVTSMGSPIFNTVRLNGLCEKIAIGLLLYKSNPDSPYCSFLNTPDKQIILIRQQLCVDKMGGLEAFFASGSSVLFDDVAWLSFDDFYYEYECKDCQDYIVNNSDLSTTLF